MESTGAHPLISICESVHGPPGKARVRMNINKGDEMKLNDLTKGIIIGAVTTLLLTSHLGIKGGTNMRRITT
jgi:hypothetical protein